MEPTKEEKTQNPTLTGKWIRMIRKGNGFIAQELTVMRNGSLKCRNLGDWDLRSITEIKALNALIAVARE